jgi:uncharacterized protein
MEIKRSINNSLISWKENKNRNPLILQGARQVGKTHLLKSFGSDNYESTAYFNFERNPELAQFFQISKEPKRIIENLSILHGTKIQANNTLIIFDEIQECNEALNSLKYFSEEAPEYHIACAGSLLGVKLSRGKSFPVGKVDFENLYPVSFSEFLNTVDETMFSYLNNIEKIEIIPDIFFNKILEMFKFYNISGGMPQSINYLMGEKSSDLCETELLNIINSYKLDFSKHANNKDIQRITYIWESLPSQLSKENKKFLYKVVKTGARAREYEDALLWLENAGLVHKIYKTEKPALPLSAFNELTAFKIFTLDVGILRRLSNLKPTVLAENNRIFSEFNGALTENYILQSLIYQFNETPVYWTSGNEAEVDFLLQYNNSIIPIEVKSNTNVKSKSLAFYRNKYNPTLSIRYSLNNLQYSSGILNIPLFMSDFTKKLLTIV